MLVDIVLLFARLSAVLPGTGEHFYLAEWLLPTILIVSVGAWSADLVHVPS